MAFPTRVCCAVLLAASSVSPTGAGQPNETADVAGPAAFLFMYRPKPGLEARFDAGYKKHLDWHREHRDPLPWYGWNVTSGDRLGLFIDGTFGISFTAFDQRVEPSADGADFRQNVGPLADPVSRVVYRVRPELSTAQPLERRQPTSDFEALHIVVRPGTERSFEKVVQEAARRRAGGTAPDYTCYQLVTGGEAPGYLFLIARDSWAAFDRAAATPLDALFATEVGNARPRRVEAALERVVLRMHAETWSYRSDLSLLPGR